MRSKWLVWGAALFVCAVPAVAQQAPTWRLVEEWRVGGEVEGALSFSDPRGLQRLPNGGLVVLDFKDQQIHFFDARGTPVRTVGRKGAGPGEYRNANGLFVMPNGQIVISDPSNTRFTILAANGDFVRTIPVQIRGYGFLWEPFVHEGKLVETVNVLDPVTRSRSSRLQVWSQDFARSDTVAVATCLTVPTIAANQLSIEIKYEGGSMMRSVPFMFPTQTSARIRGGSESWRGTGHNNVLLRQPSFTCDTLATIKLPGVRPQVSAADRAAAEKDIRDIVEQRKAIMPDLSGIPRERPWFESLRADDAGRAWVTRYLPTGTRRVEIFSPQGALIGTMPGTLPFVVGRPALMTADRIVGFVLDEDEVMHLAAWRIVR
jgi:hypothetical protein